MTFLHKYSRRIGYPILSLHCFRTGVVYCEYFFRGVVSPLPKPPSKKHVVCHEMQLTVTQMSLHMVCAQMHARWNVLLVASTAETTAKFMPGYVQLIAEASLCQMQ